MKLYKCKNLATEIQDKKPNMENTREKKIIIEISNKYFQSSINHWCRFVGCKLKLVCLKALKLSGFTLRNQVKVFF